jgi:hypothetical protein
MGATLCQQEKDNIEVVMGEYTSEINAMRWSFSRCHGFEGCKYEWYMNYLLKDEDGKCIYENEQNFYAAFGHFCHEILEMILKKELKIKDSTQYYIDNFDAKVLSYDVPENTREKYFYLGTNYFDTLDFNWLDDYEILGIEKKCLFEIDGIKFIGYIDLLIRHKETRKIIVIDHKSSEYPIGKKGGVLKKKIDDYESYKKQLYLYCQQVFEEYGVYPDEIAWNYFRDQKWLKLPFIKEEYETARKWAINLIKEIHNEENYLPKLDYFYCNNLCGFRNSCDYKLMGGE